MVRHRRVTHHFFVIMTHFFVADYGKSDIFVLLLIKIKRNDYETDDFNCNVDADARVVDGTRLAHKL